MMVMSFSMVLVDDYGYDKRDDIDTLLRDKACCRDGESGVGYFFLIAFLRKLHMLAKYSNEQCI